MININKIFQLPAETKTPGKRLRSSLDNSSKATPTNRKGITAKVTTPTSQTKSDQRKQQLKEEREKKILEEKLQKQKEKDEKEAQRKKEREEKELERKREREEKELEKKREREEKEEQRKKEKKEREEKELEKKREREEKEEQRKKEKEEKDQMKQKEKEKRLADQEAKNEEKRKKEEEERKKKEEIEIKKKKAAENFSKFFKPKPGAEQKPAVKEPEKEGANATVLAFKPFQVRADMKLAPAVRRHLESPEKTSLESVIEDESKAIEKDQLYLQLIKSGSHVAHKVLKRGRDEEDDDCAIIGEYP